MLSRFETFICSVTEIEQYWRRLAAAEMKKYGLKGGYVIYFTRLYDHPEGLTATQLQRVCGRDKADISRDMAVLEERGLLCKDRTHGRYRALISLTEKGRNLTSEIIRRAELGVKCIGEKFSDDERSCFYRMLDAITGDMRRMSESGLPGEA